MFWLIFSLYRGFHLSIEMDYKVLFFVLCLFGSAFAKLKCRLTDAAIVGNFLVRKNMTSAIFPTIT